MATVPVGSRLLAQFAPRAYRQTSIVSAAGLRVQCQVNWRSRALHTTRLRWQSSARPVPKDEPSIIHDAPDNSYSQPAVNLSHSITTEEKTHYDRLEEESRRKQRQSPWTRVGSDTPPAEQVDKADRTTSKGKLLTTPSRMLKFIIPLAHPQASNTAKQNIEPLALLAHPQQPLSYLERLIQSELPVLEDGKPPAVVFRAEDTGDSASKKAENDEDENEDIEELSSEDRTRIGGKVMRTGKLNSNGEAEDASKEADDVQEVSDLAHPNFVRWSPSTEIGDFIRDAARGKEFALDVEGTGSIYVTVPSFDDRTYYLRMRLRKASKRILELADLKQQCDKLAHKGAKRVAQMGFAGLISWWGAVYYLTFRTDLGWDVMEPVTYLVGLSTLIGGYMWFLYHNREVSYRSAMNLTISRRQSQLYDQKGFDIHKWEFLVEEGNRLRREIKMIADEYDVEWDETKDEGHKKVADALREERKKEKKKKEDDEHDDNKDDEDGDDSNGAKDKNEHK